MSNNCQCAKCNPKPRVDAIAAVNSAIEAVKRLNLPTPPGPMRGREVAKVILETDGKTVTKIFRKAGVQAQFADTQPYFKLNDRQRAEYESEAAALRAKLNSPGLHPDVRQKAQQDLQKLEHLLSMDRSPTGADPLSEARPGAHAPTPSNQATRQYAEPQGYWKADTSATEADVKAWRLELQEIEAQVAADPDMDFATATRLEARASWLKENIEATEQALHPVDELDRNDPTPENQ